MRLALSPVASSAMRSGHFNHDAQAFPGRFTGPERGSAPTCI